MVTPIHALIGEIQMEHAPLSITCIEVLQSGCIECMSILTAPFEIAAAQFTKPHWQTKSFSAASSATAPLSTHMHSTSSAVWVSEISSLGQKMAPALSFVICNCFI